MPYLGSGLAGYDSHAQLRAQNFSANGSANSFTLTYAVNDTKDIEVLVNNIQQDPFNGSYAVNGTTLGFSSPPSAGSNNILVIYRDYFQIAPPVNNQAVITDYIASQAVTTPKIGNYAVTSVKLANTLSLGTVTLSGPGTASNTFSINTRASSANHATQKQYVDALTIVFGA